jgi:hypothetical protein
VTRGVALRSLLVLALALATQHSVGQTLVYIEPGHAACAAPARAAGAATKVQRGVPVPGSIRVSCGFDQGSYTVSLSSTDAGATFSPKTFIVNFGRVVGNGAFTVTFSTLGIQNVAASITSNMGSPPVRGQFEHAAQGFEVVER